MSVFSIEFSVSSLLFLKTNSSGDESGSSLKVYFSSPELEERFRISTSSGRIEVRVDKSARSESKCAPQACFGDFVPRYRRGMKKRSACVIGTKLRVNEEIRPQAR